MSLYSKVLHVKYGEGTTIGDYKQEALTKNGTLGGSNFAVSQSTYNSDADHQAYNLTSYDSSNTSSGVGRWQSKNGTAMPQYVIYYFPDPIKITTCDFNNEGIASSESSYIVKGYEIYGSNDNSTWSLLYSGTNTVTTPQSAGAWSCTVNASDYYNYFKLNITSTQGSTTPCMLGYWGIHGPQIAGVNSKVYNIPLYTSSSDSDLNSHPAPIIMDGQTLYAPYCAEDDALASPLHCKIDGTTYRLQKQKLLTGSIPLQLYTYNVSSAISSNNILHASGGGNTIFKFNVSADFDDKKEWIEDHGSTNWWTESAHSDPFTRSFYVKISPFGVYNITSHLNDDTGYRYWTSSIEYSPEIEKYGLENGVDVTDLNPDYTYADYAKSIQGNTDGCFYTTNNLNAKWTYKNKPNGSYTLTVPDNAHVLKCTIDAYSSSGNYHVESGNLHWAFYAGLSNISGVIWFNIIKNVGTFNMYIGVTPGKQYTIQGHNISSAAFECSNDINQQVPTVFDY